jgi:PIN domain nuclease of toxin-antitoxin system
MKILLDTHIFLWFISGDTQLSIEVRDAIRDSDNEVYLSAISVWEVIVKYQLGKLSLPESSNFVGWALPTDNFRFSNINILEC